MYVFSCLLIVYLRELSVISDKNLIFLSRE